MIRGIKITNHNGESLDLDLFHPEWSGIVVNSIEGMGPPTASIVSNEVATMDGGIFASARCEQRNLVIALTMMFDPLIEDSRLRIYKYFPIKKRVSVEITTDYRQAIVYGYVESVTPDIFTNMETAQVSIICSDPFFYEMEESVYVFSGVRPLFEFPFMNNSLTKKLIEFGEIMEDNRCTINYLGDVDTGVLITCHIMRDTIENFKIWNVDTREHMDIDTIKLTKQTGITLEQGDDIIINTKTGEKNIQLLHSGIYYNIISCLNKDANWFQLTAGPNVFTFTADYGDSNMIMTMTWRNAYGGM